MTLARGWREQGHEGWLVELTMARGWREQGHEAWLVGLTLARGWREQGHEGWLVEMTLARGWREQGHEGWLVELTMARGWREQGHEAWFVELTIAKQNSVCTVTSALMLFQLHHQWWCNICTMANTSSVIGLHVTTDTIDCSKSLSVLYKVVVFLFTQPVTMTLLLKMLLQWV